MAQKRKTSAERHGVEDQPSGEAAGAEVQSEYELQRMEIIARNRARMIALGIPLASIGLQQLAPQRRPHVPLKPKEPKVAIEPTRRSTRLHPGLQGEEHKEEVEEAVGELAMFLVDGECPKCGRVLARMGERRKHFERCTGPSELPQLTDEEIAAQAAAFTEKEIAKLRQLELNLLVEATQDHATFIVIGSTGNHYKVQLSDAKRSCQCVDHRCRKHDCKHIRLVLTKLGVADKPEDWREGVERHFSEQIAQLQRGESDEEQQPAVQEAAVQKKKGRAGKQTKKATVKAEEPPPDGHQPSAPSRPALANPAQDMALNFM